jgi:hypothetical protein
MMTETTAATKRTADQLSQNLCLSIIRQPGREMGLYSGVPRLWSLTNTRCKQS